MKSHKISPATGQYQDDKVLPLAIPAGAALIAAHPVSTAIGISGAGSTIGYVAGRIIYSVGSSVYDSIAGEKIYQTNNMGNYGYDQRDPAYNPNQYGNGAINGCYPGYNC